MAFFPTESLSLSYKLSEQALTFFLWASSRFLNLLNCDLSRRISVKNYQLRTSVLETLKWTAKWLMILVNFLSNLTLISQKSSINLGKSYQIKILTCPDWLILSTPEKTMMLFSLFGMLLLLKLLVFWRELVLIKLLVLKGLVQVCFVWLQQLSRWVLQG